MAQDQKPFTETPEFKAAVAEAVAKATPAIVAAAVEQMAKAGAAPVISGGDDATRNFFSQMALQIAEISDQGTHRKRVAPEILARREEAGRKCRDLIRMAREQGLKPEYRLTAKVYLGERLIEPYRKDPATKAVIQQEIIWMGVPNDGMIPLNEIAQQIHDQFRASVGSTPHLKSITGAHGGIVAQDNRPMWMTPGGLVVKGEAPPKAFVAGPRGDDDLSFRDNNDPNAAEVFVLGTIAAPARRTAAPGSAAGGR